MRAVKTILLCLFVSLLSLGMGSAIVPDDPSPGLSYDEVIYLKAGLETFHEGFAIHFENVSRENKPDDRLKNGIFRDLDHKKKIIKSRLGGYDRDFRFPFRLDYYRGSMLVWYQNFEDVKRYEWVKSGQIKYKKTTIKTNNLEKALFYGNSGISMNTARMRNLQQALATKGVIAAFFTKLMNSELKSRYLDKIFFDFKQICQFLSNRKTSAY